MIEPLLHAERLLLHGQVDEAERIYAQTVAADPHNAIAVVGLARVAIERDDDALAYRHACRALEIDRQNAAALRLEARLSEVMAARGDSVARPAWLVPGGAAPSSVVSAPRASHAQPLVSEGERAVLARNPSMADHRARMERSEQNRAQPSPPVSGTAPGAGQQPKRRSVLARLLGRR